MALNEAKVIGDGLAKVAHAIRRTGAVYVAAMTLPENTSDEDLFTRADKIAKWIGGLAEVAEATRPPERPLGQPFP